MFPIYSRKNYVNRLEKFDIISEATRIIQNQHLLSDYVRNRLDSTGDNWKTFQ